VFNANPYVTAQTLMLDDAPAAEGRRLAWMLANADLTAAGRLGQRFWPGRPRREPDPCKKAAGLGDE
jgi:hypothetical protein